MPGPLNEPTRFSLTLARLRCRLTPHASNMMLCLGAAIVGALLAVIVPKVDQSERLIVGNAGGSLAVLIEVADSRILVGAGTSRTHSSDLIGRATRPWDREIDLLVVPGWDQHHAAGALGLLERDAVNAVAVTGLPGDAPIWTLLEREAGENDVPVRYLDGSHELEVDKSMNLTLAALSRSPEGAWIRLEHHGKRIDIIDTADDTNAMPDPRTLPVRNNHLLINIRGQELPSGTDPQLSLMPAPFWQDDFPVDGSPYWTGIERNEYIMLDLAEDAIAVNLDEIQVRDE